MVTTVAVLVHVLSHGMLTSAGMLYLEIMKKFGTDFTEPAGILNFYK